MRLSHMLAGLLSVLVFSCASAGRCAEPKKLVDDKTKIAVKVIVTRQGGTDLLAEPAGGKAGTLGEMEVAYVFSDDGNPNRVVNGKPWYWVGRDGDGDPEGWVAGDAVREWRTRCALVPSDNLVPGKRVFVIHRTDGHKDAKGDDDIVYDGQAPAGYRLFAPILAPRESDDKPYQVLVCGATAQGTLGAGASGKPAQSFAFADAKLEVVFVVQTVADKAPWLKVMKNAVMEFANRLAKRKDRDAVARRVRFGLVEYADFSLDPTHARVKAKLTDAWTFLDEVNGVRIKPNTGRSPSKDVVAGLLTAIDRKPDGSFGDAVGWSSNSSKHIVLCGDASAGRKNTATNSTGLSIADVLRKASPETIADDAARVRAQIVCHAILTKNEQATRSASVRDGRDDWERAATDFTLVAANGGRFAGLHMEMTAGDDQSEKAVADKLVTTFSNAVAVLAADPLPGKATASAAGPAVGRSGDGALFVGVALGTARQKDDNDQVVAIKACCLTYQELQRLTSTLTFMRERFERMTPKQRAGADKLLAAFQAAVASALIGEPQGPTNLSECLSGLPLRTPLLELTVQDLATWSDAKFRDWVEGLRGAEKGLKGLLNIKQGGSGVNAWMKMGRVFVTFVPVERLP